MLCTIRHRDEDSGIMIRNYFVTGTLNKTSKEPNQQDSRDMRSAG